METYGRVHDEGVSWRVMRQRIAEVRPGWQLDYIDTLTWQDVEDLWAYLDGVAAARANAQKR